MNIYIPIEIAHRELDSKILLATLAASRNHKVIISDLKAIKEGSRRKLLSPGIFLDKSLTPNDIKTKFHQFLIENGFIVTSIDEENNLVNHGYDDFALDRFSEKTISQTSAIFGWGPEDVETLKRIYPKHSSKIHMTGSPRIDLLNPLFINYWTKPDIPTSKPYLLISGNFEVNDMKPMPEKVKAWRKGGYFKRDLKLFKRKFDLMGEHYKRMGSFIEAIQYLSKNINEYDIILRPHPGENINAWKIYLENLQNVHVVREGSIIPWINNAFALMHNSCTTAIESTIFGKPVITYNPFQLKYYTGEIPNQLGVKVSSKEQLLDEVNNLFEFSKKDKQSDSNDKYLESIKKKIFIDDKNLASENIIKLWESLDNKKLSNNSKWKSFEYFVKFKDLKSKINITLKKFFKQSQYQEAENYKFPPLDENAILEKFYRLKDILKLQKNLQCKVLSNSVILIIKI